MSVNYFNTTETSQAVITFAVKKCQTVLIKVFVLGILGGLFVSLGYFGALTVMAGTQGYLTAGMTKMLGATVFPVGLMFILMVGGDLFTGNALNTAAFLDKQVKIITIVNNLFIVWIANFIGTVCSAYLIYLTASADEEMVKLIIQTASSKLALSNTQIIISGFFCNILVSLSIWATLAAKDIVGKVAMIYFPIFLFVITGFQHCVANMFLFSYSYFLGGDFALSTILNAIVMATIGNWLSGGLFVPVIYYYIYLRK